MKKRIALVALSAIIALLSFAVTTAQQPQPPDQPQQPRTPPPGPPEMPGDAMFTPDMIMQHQRELGLTDEQKTFMRGEINKTVARFNDLQWQLHDAMEALDDLMKTKPVNEEQALAQLDKVLDAEREIKKLHMGLAIRIKNALTPDQQQKLQNMRHGRAPGPFHGPGPGSPGQGPFHGPGGPAPRGSRPGEPGAPPRPDELNF